MSAVAELQDLRVWRRAGDDAVALVDGISLRVGAGEILGVVGETGAGKTLTIRALLGVLPRNLRAEGRARVVETTFDLGQLDRMARPAALARDAAMVFQNPATMLDPLVRVEAQLVEAVLRHRLLDARAAGARAVELLVALGFEDPEAVLRLYPHQLSGGMAQRAAIAMALMTRPRLLIVDEPTSALDANLRVEVLTLLERATRDAGIAVVLVSHDLPLIARFSSRVVVMYAGRIVESGDTRKVLEEPSHPYTEALLATASTVHSANRAPLAAIPGVPPAPGEWPPGCVFAGRCRYTFDRCLQERPTLRGDADQRAACLLRERGRMRERVG
jgi:oligopeptide/dipeptide ABC transporter ATP-binding protein